jgi:predicted transcriptional regulator
MSDLNTSFTFRLTCEDKAALAELAERVGCDRGAVLRRMIRRSAPGLPRGKVGRFVAHGQTLRLKLQVSEQVE